MSIQALMSQSSFANLSTSTSISRRRENTEQLPQIRRDSVAENDNPMSNIKEQVDKAVKSSKELQLLRPFMSQQQNHNIAGKSEVMVESEQRLSIDSPAAVNNQSIGLEQIVTQQSRTELEINSEAPQEQQVDPLVFDLDNNGFHTTGTKNGVWFDLDADGQLDRMSNLAGADAFLALDKNNNGHIDNGSELFGDQNGAAHGFDELAKYDDNQDGVIDKNDAVFEDLRLVQISEQGQQSMRLADHQIQSITLAYKNGYSQTSTGDPIAQTGQSQTNSSNSINIADIKLNIISK
jgi:hypothetical protein